MCAEINAQIHFCTKMAHFLKYVLKPKFVLMVAISDAIGMYKTCHTSATLTLSLRNFRHPFSRSVRNYFVDARKNHGYGYKNWYISVTNKARHKICTSLDL